MSMQGEGKSKTLKGNSDYLEYNQEGIWLNSRLGKSWKASVLLSKIYFYSRNYLLPGCHLESKGLELAKCIGFLKPFHQRKLLTGQGRIDTSN